MLNIRVEYITSALRYRIWGELRNIKIQQLGIVRVWQCRHGWITNFLSTVSWLFTSWNYSQKEIVSLHKFILSYLDYLGGTKEKVGKSHDTFNGTCKVVGYISGWVLMSTSHSGLPGPMRTGLPGALVPTNYLTSKLTTQLDKRGHIITRQPDNQTTIWELANYQPQSNFIKKETLNLTQK